MNAIKVKRIAGGGELPFKIEKDTPVYKFESGAINKQEEYGKKVPRKYELRSVSETLPGKLYIKKNTIPMNDSSKSEEEAATMIQAMYRGYKTRKRFRKIRKRQSNDKVMTKRIADIQGYSKRLNLLKPVESINVATCPSSQEQTNKEDKNNASNRRQSITEADVTEDEDKRCHRKESTESTMTNKFIKTIMSPAYSNTNDDMESTITPSDTTDMDDEKMSLCKEKSVRNYQCREINMVQTARKCRRNKLRNLSKLNYSTIEADIGYRVPESEAVLVFGGIDPHMDYGRRGNVGKDVYGYWSVENSWRFVGEIPEPRHHHSVVYSNDRIYLAGGVDPRENDDIQHRSIALGTVWSYDPRIKNWYTEPNMLTPRQNFGFVVSNGKIFAIGGQDNKGMALKTVEAFDLVSHEWTEVQSMHIARIGLASVKYEGHIWVAGGMNDSRIDPLVEDVECYDVSRNLWTCIESLRYPRCFSCLYISSNRLFIIGGAARIASTEDENDSSNVESICSIDVWNTSLCAWQLQTEMSIARHGHAVSSIGNRFLILGGVTTSTKRALKNVECYCYEKNQWTKNIPSLPFAISGHAAITIPSLPLDIQSCSKIEFDHSISYRLEKYRIQ